MKYYTIEVVTKNGAKSQAIFERADIDVAKKEYHNTLAYNINLDGIEKVSVAIVDEELKVLKSETWAAPVPEPDPAVEDPIVEQIENPETEISE